MKYILIFLPSVILIILGISIKYFKAYNLISGYNTMSAEKKKNVDVKGLGNSVGYFCFVLAVLIFFFILFLMLNLIYITIAISVLFVLSIIFFIITAQKYDGNAMKNGKFKTKTKVILGVLITFFVIVFLGVGYLLYQSVQPSVIDVNSAEIKISGLYGAAIPYKDIIEITIHYKLPDVTLRTNGSAVGSKLKGYFNLKDIGNAKLSVDTKIPLFIYLKTKDKIYYLNIENKEKTIQLYEQIIVKLKNVK